MSFLVAELSLRRFKSFSMAACILPTLAAILPASREKLSKARVASVSMLAAVSNRPSACLKPLSLTKSARPVPVTPFLRAVTMLSARFISPCEQLARAVPMRLLTAAASE